MSPNSDPYVGKRVWGSTDSIRATISSTSFGTPCRISPIGLGGPSKRALTTAVASSPSKGGTPVIAW
ncbi:MAG: hypothetical protein BWX70_01983 [Verrucomicrobia bacterium ADurb.Bin070]|nr:MAG: hypothetical protein BWX70_01983 [Verrucomicrobia bacterium ADurb.Bin070]